MKLLIDNNLSSKLVFSLEVYFPGTNHIRSLLNVTADDDSIWNYAKNNNFIILTKDNDFNERSQLYGCPPKIVHLVCGNKSTTHILDLLLSRQSEIQSFAESDAENCILKVA